jgi:hypothetical protein
MPEFLKHYGTTEGPLGLPMQDRQAFQLESILKALPPEDRALKHAVVAKGPTELLDGERADVSWISTEDIDRDREIVVSKGMNDAHFKLNPLVTLQHAYWRPPVGRSLWRKRVKDGPMVGIKAKTHYPPRPADWADDGWDPDTTFALVKAGLLQGKSIGFIALKSHAPSSDEIAARPGLADVRRVIDEWLLLEYACVFLPANQAALVEAVSKGAVAVPDAVLPALGFDQSLPPAVIPFTPVEEIAKELRRRLERLDVTALIEGRVQEAYDAARGRV